MLAMTLGRVGEPMDGRNYMAHIKRERQARKYCETGHRAKPKDIPHLVGRLLGIEIEYYPSVATKAAPLTTVGTDGSLGSGGAEIRRLTWQDETGHLAGLRAMTVVGRVSEKCGLHIHVDCRHMDPDVVASTYDTIVNDYYPILKAFVPPSRLNNQYCRWASNRPEENGDAQLNSRYCACNWRAYSEHETLEFRCQGGMIDLCAIEAWALICQWIVSQHGGIHFDIARISQALGKGAGCGDVEGSAICSGANLLIRGQQ
jgi:hypothetical protein